jgi:Tfp pilus assembly protein PilE
MFIIAGVVFVVGIVSPNHTLLPALLVLLGVLVGAVFLNRRGYITLAGAVTIVIFELGLMLSILATPGGLTVFALPLFDLFVQAEMIAVSLLPVGYVFVVAGCNVAFILLALTFMPRAHDLSVVMQTSAAGDAYIRPIVIQVIVAVVSYLWVRGATRAMARADRAEVIAALQHKMVEQERAIAEQKEQLELGIQQILDTHVRVANGHFNARAPLMQDNVLAQLAVSLNNLLSRLQRYALAERQVQFLRTEIARVVEAVRHARLRGTSVQLERGGTPVDSVIVELNGCNIQQSLVSPGGGQVKPRGFRPTNLQSANEQVNQQGSQQFFPPHEGQMRQPY